MIDVELGVSVPLLAPEAQFLGTLELGVALSNRLGLDFVLLFESLVSRADVGPGGAFVDVYSANILVGVEERRVVWRKLSVFGTVAGGILVDTYKGFEPGGALHLDAGVGWTLGPGDFRVRPADFALFFTDAVGVAWRATAGYALRF